MTNIFNLLVKEKIINNTGLSTKELIEKTKLTHLQVTRSIIDLRRKELIYWEDTKWFINPRYEKPSTQWWK